MLTCIPVGTDSYIFLHRVCWEWLHLWLHSQTAQAASSVTDTTLGNTSSRRYGYGN